MGVNFNCCSGRKESEDKTEEAEEVVEEVELVFNQEYYDNGAWYEG